MGRDALRYWVICGLLFGLAGCAGDGARNVFSINAAGRPDRPDVAASALAADPAEPPTDFRHLLDRPARSLDFQASWPASSLETDGAVASRRKSGSLIQPVGHQSQSPTVTPAQDATLTIEGRTYRVQLVEESPVEDRPVRIAGSDSSQPGDAAGVPRRLAHLQPSAPQQVVPSQPFPSDALPLNLPTALSMIGGQHPAVGFAQWRVQEAYARLDQANVLWLPSLQAGLSLNRHDGNLQASDGNILDVNRNSFQYGLGAGAVGAGTTQRPGIVARFQLADAIFQPKIARKTAWARGHAANGVINEQLLQAAVGYFELLDSEQDLRIMEASRTRTAELSKLTGDFAATGQGLQADADRLTTELRLVENRLVAAEERIDVASARLAQTLSLDAGKRIVPLDPTVVPIELVSLELDKPTLICRGLANRPELKESQALVAAAFEQFRRQKYCAVCSQRSPGIQHGWIRRRTGKQPGQR